MKKEKISLLNDDVIKNIFNVSSYTGALFVLSFIREISKEEAYEVLVELSKENIRYMRNNKTCILDMLLRYRRDYYINIEFQRRMNNIETFSDKIFDYLCATFISKIEKGQKYGSLPYLDQIVLYDGSISDVNELVILHQFSDEYRISKFINKARCYVLQLGKLTKILKEKGVDGLSKIHRICFYLRYYHSKRYKKVIEYIYKKDWEARYIDMKYKEFMNDPDAWLEAYKLEHNIKAIQDDFDLTLEKAMTKSHAEGKIEGKAEGKIEGKAEGKIEGELEGLRKSIIRIFTKIFGYLSFELRFRIERSTEEQLILIEENINLIHEQKDILYILNHS